ncbi:FAD/NAD(P)-binding domain-containing protein [Lentinus tigrinus ALCF2SS1-7]|uniref:FAD/NAD(P)-binding domain-containing protein n=1 Tax=Lentinus tigrinus ALCF2SS1-6 TaxID=1328759 RepID=A0A5C2S1A9_9APHY|nr:FAD/NAD(P)-binding domain-containing protein [Lentinus tigrinus ALCF2SS1-6]RPD79557.1 FAD/NAD(P)-binding domain-containing protein [Lentinus tigrinus ALCF2SS1-7]
MRSPVILIAATAAFFPTYAFQLPFKIPFFSRSTQEPLALPEVQQAETIIPNRIAIIGAGAAGSSAAFWISKAKERFGVDVEVDVYDKNGYIGGRSTTVQPYGDESLEPVELGGSVFVKVNKILWRAVSEFDLELEDFGRDDDSVMGIWDGQEFVLTTGGGSLLGNWLDKFKILWRYGYKAPTKTQALVDAMASSIIRLYEPNAPVWQNATSLLSELEWADVTAQTMAEYLDLHGVDRRFSRELVEAATRVNYGQNVDEIHALEGMVSLAANGASTVKGGNWQIFESFVAASNATLFLNTTVKAVSRFSASGPWMVQSSAFKDPRLYRSIILAAPYDQTGISFSTKTPLAEVKKRPYIHLNVTLLSTSSPTPNASYFNLGHGHKAPNSVLTTYDGLRQRGHSEPEFNSLTYHGKVLTKDGEKRVNAEGAEEWVVKIFSKQRLEDKWLEEMFEGKVGWVLRKEWDAYPVLPPTVEFPPVKLAEGLYYVNAFEPVISTMETETLAARNVVDLLMQEQYGAGLCKPHVVEDGEAARELDDDFVYGWDC